MFRKKVKEMFIVFFIFIYITIFALFICSKEVQIYSVKGNKCNERENDFLKDTKKVKNKT